MINNTVLVGRLTKDIDLRYTENGTAVGNFILAVNRPFKSKNNEQDADFISCVVWRNTAENMANYTKKGSLVGITGRIQTRNYEKDGQRIYVTEVVAENVQFLDTKSNTDSTNNTSVNEYPRNNQNSIQSKFESNNSNPKNDNFNTQSKQSDAFNSMGNPADISDDDLPF